MANPTVNLERKRLLELANEYREKGYEVLFHPNLEDLPDFLKNYRPDMIARRGEEAVVIEIISRSALNLSSNQYLRNLAQAVEENPGWRFELVMINPEDTIYSPQAEESLQAHEIESRLPIARQLTEQNLESALLYSWSLVEATLRLIAQKEELDLKRFDPLYLVKKLATEGIISRSEYRLLMEALSWRNAIAHGFKAKRFTQTSVYKLIELTEQFLKALRTNEQVN